jgi:hypothetical protein
MSYRSNSANAYSEAYASAVEYEIPFDLLPPKSLTEPLWRSLVSGLRETLAPEKLPPLQISSRPVNVGLLLGDRLSMPWFRTVFTNLGDVISPETLPPLELESSPVDVGELITDQLSHFWWASLLRNLADWIAPEKLPVLELTAKPVAGVIPQSWLLLPLWSEVISTPKVFYPDKPAAERSTLPLRPKPVAVSVATQEDSSADPRPAELVRDIRRSRLRLRIWIAVAAAQILYMIVMAFWPRLF